MSDYRYDEIEPGYLDDVYGRRRGIQSKWHHDKFTLLVEEVGAYRKHLDIGCASGTFVSLLDGDSVGVDIAEPQIEYAKRKHGERFVRAEGYPYPFEDATFNLVTIIEVIEHLEIEEVDSMLFEARRLLAPGGRIIVSTPNYRSLWPIIELASNMVLDYSIEHQHITKFNPNRLRQTLSKFFAETEVKSFLGISPFVAPLGWGFSNFVRNLEKRALKPGLLLLGTASKA